MAKRDWLNLAGAAEPADLERGSIFFVGTATTIIRYGGFTVLTDPNFLHAGDHAHLGYGMTSPRLTDPAIEIDDLPPLDLCVLSHLHGDHWDAVASARLRKDLPIATTKHAAAGLRKQGFANARPLGTWQSATARRGEAWLRITALPGRHGPGPVNALLPPVMGSMLEWGVGAGPARTRLYISGDTLMHRRLAEIPRRYPSIDIALLHLGGTRLFGLLLTMDARQGIQALELIRPATAIPIHYDDYPVFKSPLEDFVRAVAAARLDTKVHYLHRGEAFHFATPAQRERSVGG